MNSYQPHTHSSANKKSVSQQGTFVQKSFLQVFFILLIGVGILTLSFLNNGLFFRELLLGTSIFLILGLFSVFDEK